MIAYTDLFRKFIMADAIYRAVTYNGGRIFWFVVGELKVDKYCTSLRLP